MYLLHLSLLALILTQSICGAADPTTTRKSFFDSICVNAFSTCFNPQDTASNSLIFSLPWSKPNDPHKSTKAKIVNENSPDAELMINLLTGIKASTLKWSKEPERQLTKADFETVDKIKADREGNVVPPKAWYDFKIKDVAPLVFRDMRRKFGVTTDNFLNSLTDQLLLNEISSPGKSGSLLYFSQDYRFVFKTIRTIEYDFFKSILPQYHEHVTTNPNTLIARVFGLFKVKLPGDKVVPFVVMSNIFSPNVNVHEIFDLKGSTVKRYVPPEKAAKSKVPVLQDLNFLERNKKLLLGPEKRGELLKQLKIDIDFLTSVSIMDYSFVVGMHDLKRGRKEKFRSAVNEVLEDPEVDPSNRLANLVNKASRELQPKSLGDAAGRSHRELPERRVSIFHRDNGGFQATDSENRPQDYIYYFGIIDIFGEYHIFRRLDRYWKLMKGADKVGISNQKPAVYGPRLYNFIESITAH
ncbi:hypothetical protein BKA69DRAFT_530612 [Paraphysoderma sedebokerense]|nr:hypothetical protein BKA69DRAFT_530612 [Paraphysoderma sedebokerense]